MEERAETIAGHLSERILALQELLQQVRAKTRGFADAYERLDRWADRTAQLLNSELGQTEQEKFMRRGRGTMHVHKLSVFSSICEEYIGFLQALCEDVRAHPTEWVGMGTGQQLASGRVIRAILFSDIVESTQRVGEIGDAAWQKELQEHYRTSEKLVSQFSGRVVKHTGDGILALFELPASALKCALELQSSLKGTSISVRAGVGVGEVDLAGQDVAGLAVHVTARLLEDNDGFVLATEAVRELAAGSGLTFTDFGERELRGVGGEWRVFAVSDAHEDVPMRKLPKSEYEQRLKELLELTLQLKDAAFAANAAGLRWSNEMTNAATKIQTALRQLPPGTLPVQVSEYATMQPNQVIGAWRVVHSLIEKALPQGGA
jgi:class 3 adenylate cyclase